MKLTVVIVNYNVKYYVGQCLISLMRALQDIETEIYVVDNHSHDGSVEYLQENFPGAHVIASNHNLGFARANNIAIRQSVGEYVLLLNPDTVVGENTISESISFMDGHPDAGGLGVKMLKSDGTCANESRRGLPTPLTSFYKMSGLCARYPQSKRFGRYYMGYLPWDEPAQIEVVSGAYCMLRRSALDKIGLLDEDFFMYGEDIDLSYRLLKGGYANWYLPVHILHYKGESTHTSSFRYVHVFYEAMFVFFKKHYGHMSFLLSIPIKVAIYTKAFFALVNMLAKSVGKMLGFTSRNGNRFPEYLFLGSREAREKCETLAKRKGLAMKFVECDESSLPNGHLQLPDNFSPHVLTHVVYDVDAYSYDSILRIFSSHPFRNVMIGTYYKDKNMIITDQEIFL